MHTHSKFLADPQVFRQRGVFFHTRRTKVQQKFHTLRSNANSQFVGTGLFTVGAAAALETSPSSRLTVPDTTDHAHREPMHILVKNAGSTIAQLLVKSGDAWNEYAEQGQDFELQP